MSKLESLDCGQYAPTGEQSAITPTIIEIVKTLQDDELPLIEEISRRIKSLKNDNNTKEVDFSRKPDEIIKSGHSRGCHEDGLLFVTGLRAKGKEASYIQAFLREDLVNYSIMNEDSATGGHVFIKTLVSGEIAFINASTGEITKGIPEKYVFGKEGLDSWDIGLKQRADYIRLFLETKTALGV